MYALIAKYAFWIVLCIPVAAAGIWFCIGLFRENRAINKELDDIEKEREIAAMKRDLFEISYQRRRSEKR